MNNKLKNSIRIRMLLTTFIIVLFFFVKMKVANIHQNCGARKNIEEFSEANGTVYLECYADKQELIETFIMTGRTITLESGAVFTEQNGCIYINGNLTEKERKADKEHYQNRMGKRAQQIEAQSNKRHELEIAIERTKTAAFFSSAGKIIVRPEYIAKKLIEEIAEPIIKPEIVEKTKEKITPVISEPVSTPIPEPISEPKPDKGKGHSGAPGQNKEPNPNKPVKKPANPNKPDKPDKEKEKSI